MGHKQLSEFKSLKSVEKNLHFEETVLGRKKNINNKENTTILIIIAFICIEIFQLKICCL